ncbi:MAG TPA: hypothetical protein VFT22_13545 [Kofleriaceae bacterium]|nr:hypothetical protein [Kofleriaceae bacterium]
MTAATGARSLVFGVGFSPTKPLLPTHLKGLIWLDLALRATRAVVPVDCIANATRALWDATIQCIRFWAALDADPATSSPRYFDDKDDTWIGEEYVRKSRAPAEVSPELLAAYRGRLERGWTHPSARRILEHWQAQYEVMGITTPRAELTSAAAPPSAEIVEQLRRLDCAIDLRPWSGGVYVDATAAGLPLRPLIDELGRENYLMQILGVVLGLAGAYDRISILYDAPTALDFRIVAQVLSRLGKRALLIEAERIDTPGIAGTSRAGGWKPCTCAAILERYVPRYPLEVVRLGLRLYFIMYVPLASKAEFSYDLLDRAMRKARAVSRAIERAGAAPSAPPEEIASVVEPLTRRRFFERVGLIDPHALLSLLLSANSLRHHGAVLRSLCAWEAP